jgi:hypothetical protein
MDGSVLPFADSGPGMSLLRRRMARARVAGQIIEPIPLSRALSEFIDDAQSDWVAANGGQMLSQKVGGAAEVAGRRRADHFDVMAFPVHLPAARGIRGCFGERAEISHGELEGGVGSDGLPELRYRARRVDGPLSLAIKGRGLNVCCHRPTMILDRGAGAGRLSLAGAGLFGFLRHGSQVGPLA